MSASATLDAAVICLMGLPGSGKTTVAERLRPATGFRVVSRDTVRLAMFSPCTFTYPEKAAAFESVVAAVRVNSELGAGTIVEGMPFSREGEVEAIAAASRLHGLRTYPIYCDVPVEVAKARVTRDRSAGVPMADDRDDRLVEEVHSRFRTLHPETIVVDATRPVDVIVQEILATVVRGGT